MKKIMAFLLPSSLIVGIVVLAYSRISCHHELWDSFYLNADIVIIALYLAWIVYETSVSSIDTKQDNVVRDFGTREFYGLSQALTICSALWVDPVWHRPGLYHAAGLLIFTSGVCFRIWAIQTLGNYYSHSVRKIDEHRIIDLGPYRYVRHPAYTGMITAHIGITIYFFNYMTCAIFILMLIPSIVIRIFVEERTLMTIEGYAEFSKRRKRLIPCI